jgi:hypothetical protein
VVATGGMATGDYMDMDVVRAGMNMGTSSCYGDHEDEGGEEGAGHGHDSHYGDGPPEGMAM